MMQPRPPMKPLAPVTRLTFWFCRNGLVPSIEYDYASRYRAGHQQAKTVVYLVEFVDAADQVIEIELLVHVEIGEDREIDVGADRTVIGTADDAEDNRNCACLIFQRLPGVKGVGDKNIRVPVDEFFRGGAQFIRVTRRPPAIINLNILAFRPTSLLETSSEGRDECWR